MGWDVARTIQPRGLGCRYRGQQSVAGRVGGHHERVEGAAACGSRTRRAARHVSPTSETRTGLARLPCCGCLGAWRRRPSPWPEARMRRRSDLLPGRAGRHGIRPCSGDGSSRSFGLLRGDKGRRRVQDPRRSDSRCLGQAAPRRTGLGAPQASGEPVSVEGGVASTRLRRRTRPTHRKSAEPHRPNSGGAPQGFTSASVRASTASNGFRNGSVRRYRVARKRAEL